MLRLALTFLAALLSVAAATSYVRPELLLVASDYGSYGFKSLPQGMNRAAASAKTAVGELVRLQTDGTLKTLWKRPLVNTPSRVLISVRGHVVTLDNWAGQGSPTHAVVIYDPTGRVVADLKFSQGVTDPRSCPRCQSMDGPFLTWGYAPKFTSYGNDDEWFLLLRDNQGKGPTISLRTGQLKTVWNGIKRRE